MLVVYQISGGWQAMGPKKKLYSKFVREMIRKFVELKMEKILRNENMEADALAKFASQRDTQMLGTIERHMSQPICYHENSTQLKQDCNK